MNSSKLVTSFAPDVYKSLSGLLLIHKPPSLSHLSLVQELRARITDSLNELQPRPISTRVIFNEESNGKREVIQVPNLADHPLVVGPRYLPWEISMIPFKPLLTNRFSGIEVFVIGSCIKYYMSKIRTKFANVYHITGRFGFKTDNYFEDGKILDRCQYNNIRISKLDQILSRIETSQLDRLFDSANVPIDSEEAYQLAKAWPSRPPRMAKWPVIYRIRCIHFKLPEFKIEVTVSNENELFLGNLCHSIGLMLKSGAYTVAVRRVKLGPFSIDDSLTDKEWDLQSIVNNLSLYNRRHKEIHDVLRQYKKASVVRSEYEPSNAFDSPK